MPNVSLLESPFKPAGHRRQAVDQHQAVNALYNIVYLSLKRKQEMARVDRISSEIRSRTFAQIVKYFLELGKESNSSSMFLGKSDDHLILNKRNWALFNAVDRKYVIKCADDWIRTADLWCRKRPLHQLSQNHALV